MHKLQQQADVEIRNAGSTVLEYSCVEEEGIVRLLDHSSVALQGPQMSRFQRLTKTWMQTLSLLGHYACRRA